MPLNNAIATTVMPQGAGPAAVIQRQANGPAAEVPGYTPAIFESYLQDDCTDCPTAKPAVKVFPGLNGSITTQLVTPPDKADGLIAVFHPNEQNAATVAKKLHKEYCVNGIFVDTVGKKKSRHIDVISGKGKGCYMDPNRIFGPLVNTKAGLKQVKGSGSKKEAAKQLLPFQRELQDTVKQAGIPLGNASAIAKQDFRLLVMHNNTAIPGKTNRKSQDVNYKKESGVNAKKYEDKIKKAAAARAKNPSKPYTYTDDAKVHLSKGTPEQQNYDNFIYVNNEDDFNALAAKGYNVFLQGPRIDKPDGSLSEELVPPQTGVGLPKGKHYINVEAVPKGPKAATQKFQEQMGHDAAGVLGFSKRCAPLK